MDAISYTGDNIKCLLESRSIRIDLNVYIIYLTIVFFLQIIKERWIVIDTNITIWMNIYVLVNNLVLVIYIIVMMPFYLQST